MRENGCSGKLCPMQVGSVDNCKLTKEQCPYFTQDVDYQAILQVIRSEVAREIFEEIDKILNESRQGEYSKELGFLNRVSYNGYVLAKGLSELKKKYTGDK